MIKANELRLGNIVNENGKNKKVVAIMPGYIATELIDGEPFFTGTGVYEPIPLRPEILELFLITAKMYLSKNDVTETWIELDFDRDHYNIFLKHKIKREVVFENILLSYEIRFLHQLQNIYFCLTREELEVDQSGGSPSAKHFCINCEAPLKTIIEIRRGTCEGCDEG